VIALLWLSSALAAEPATVQLDAELGFLAPLYHRIQFGQQGTELNYISEGGQDNLFAIGRATATVARAKNRYTFVWQPLELRSTVAIPHEWQVDSVVFDAGQPVDLRYGFSFWRASWGRTVWSNANTELSLGLGMQIRNATIGFTAVDGSRAEFNRDIGPVPLLESELRHRTAGGGFFEVELDGFYAPIKYLNGRGVDVVGAIVDAQVRWGIPMDEQYDAWLGVRYLAGGGSGTGTPDDTSDGYTKNWLQFATVTLGIRR